MGECFSGSSDEATRALDRQLAADSRKDAEVIKLLFLGTGGSGKSTLFKQLRISYGDGLSPKSRQLYKANVYKNMKDGLALLYDELMDPESELEMDKDDQKTIEEVGEAIKQSQETNEMSKELAAQMKAFWNTTTVQKAWTQRAVMQIQDSLAYFMASADRIAADDYCPSQDDVLNVRSRTTGIVEENFMIKNRPFLIVDVGGQRSERKKWIKCFDDVTGIIFVVALSEYDQMLYEDDTKNRMEESLDTFGKLNSEHLETFEDTSMILFLNKEDLFRDKIANGININICFPDYNGPCEDEPCFDYIQKQYLKQNARKGRKIFVHRTNATDTGNMRKIFDAVNHTMISKALIKAGLLVA